MRVPGKRYGKSGWFLGLESAGIVQWRRGLWQGAEVIGRRLRAVHPAFGTRGPKAGPAGPGRRAQENESSGALGFALAIAHAGEGLGVGLECVGCDPVVNELA